MSVFAIDHGYRWVKSIWNDETLVFPHALGSPDEAAYRPVGLNEVGGGKPITVGWGDAEQATYFVGQLAEQQSGFSWATVSRSRSPQELRAMLAESFDRLNVGNTDIPILVCGLPSAWYTDQTRDTLTELLKGIIRYRRGNGAWNTVNVKDVKVVPQPMGTYFSLAFDGSGNLKDQSLWKIENSPARVAILDIGYGTVDCEVALQGKPLGPDRWTIEKGIRLLVEALQQNVSQMYNISLDVTDADQAIRSDKVWVSDRFVALPIETERAYLAQAIISELQTQWGNGDQFHKIVLTGGGAAVLGNLIREVYPRAITPESPELCNVRGYELYGRTVLSRQAD